MQLSRDTVDCVNEVLTYWINVTEGTATLHEERKLLLQIRPKRHGVDKTVGDKRSDGTDFVVDTQSVDGVVHQSTDPHQSVSD